MRAETAEPGERAETRVRFKDGIGLLAVNCMTPEKFRRRAVLDSIGWAWTSK